MIDSGWMSILIVALELRTAEPSLAGAWESAWPILAGGILFGILIAIRRSLGITVNIPPGDLIVPLSRGLAALRARCQGVAHSERWRVNFVPAIERVIHSSRLHVVLTRAEAACSRREVTALFILLLLSLLWLLLANP
ncbi:MAG: hypothetical protein WD490_00215 [Opitutales bacterium]